MKTLVCTLAHGDAIKEMAEITHPLMIAYARKIGAKFCRLGAAEWPEHISPQWQKFALWDLFRDFDRIIFFDTDIIINVDAMPNLFEVVPDGKLGVYHEGLICDRYATICAALNENGILSDHLVYDGSYFNTGVMVLSKCHRDLFIWPEKFKDNFYEQSLINARAFAYTFPKHQLDYKFNRMSVMDDLTGEDRWASPLIHYAGSNDRKGACGGMKEDIKRWKDKTPAKTRIVIECTGGLGDVVYSEPVIRHMIERVYADVPNTEFHVITSQYERVFAHFDKYPNVIVSKTASFDRLEPTCVLQTHPHVHDKWRMMFPYECSHNIDFAVCCMLRASMANEFKQVMLWPQQSGHDELMKVFPNDGKGRTNDIVVHAGSGWQSKTFPLEYWQKIIEGLTRKRRRIILIGQTISATQGYVPVKCPDGGIDLRDKLTLGALFALIQVTPALLTNESSPLCIAGAFQQHIYLIANPKRPEYVLPWRNGSVWHKSTAFMGKKLCCEHIGRRPTNPDNVTIGQVTGDIMDYLPDADEIVRGIVNGK